jgi:diguanylate cyclase (GGDEF)-like protein
MTPPATNGSRMPGPPSAPPRWPRRDRRVPGRPQLLLPRRLLLASVAALALLLVSVVLAVAYSIHTLDEASIKAERERAAAALQAVLEPGSVIDGELALRLTRDFSLARAHFVPPGTAAQQEISLALPGNDNLILAWEPRRFGTELALLLAPIRLLVSAVFLAGIGWFLFRLYRLTAELEERRHAAQQLATRDPLTGLGNRLAFDQGLEQFFEEKRVGALLYLDLDDFKRVNDTLGHGAGDELLRILAGRLSGFLREGDLAARIGGDEFGLLLAGRASRPEIAELAADLAMTIAEPVRLGSTEVTVGTCIGIALAAEHMGDPTELVRAADEALYRAKALGNGCFLFAGEFAGGVESARASSHSASARAG